MESYIAPTSVPAEEVDRFQARVAEFIRLPVEQRPQIPFDDALKGELKRRAPPKMLSAYTDVSSLAGLIGIEIADVGTRIARYQCIERYKYFFETTDKRMRSAFIEHTYSLRTAELYLVAERGEQALRFIGHVLRMINVAPPNAAGKFAKSFKASFARRLRERHRMTHGHERPSLLSRITSVPSEVYETDEGKR